MSDNNSESIINKFFSEKLSLILSIISLSCIVIAAVIFLIFGNWHFSSILDEGIIGQFGDFIGGVIGTILAFVAAVLYYVALREQRRDIAINQESARLQNEALLKQIEEFEKQKEELEETRKVYEQQSKTMKLQQFESNFYSFLNVCISIKNELNRKTENNDYFQGKYNELYSFAKDKLEKDKSPIKCHRLVVNSYVNLFLIYKGELSHYFKSIYRLIKIIDTNQALDENEKVFYSKIVRSQLTEYELLLMNYNYHSIYALKARDLIYKYNLLKHTYCLSKIEFKYKYDLMDKFPSLISFFNLLGTILEETINKFCDSFEIQETEKKFHHFNCIISISNKDDVRIKILCLDRNKLIANFKDIIYDYIYDKLFISQFRMIENGVLNCFEENAEDILIYNYILNEEKIGRINIDK